MEKDFQMSSGDPGTGLAKYKNGSENRNLRLQFEERQQPWLRDTVSKLKMGHFRENNPCLSLTGWLSTNKCKLYLQGWGKGERGWREGEKKQKEE